MFTITRQRQTFLVVMAAAVVGVLCCGCSDNGIGGAFYEQEMGNIVRDDISRYKTVPIGTQTWITRNLDIKTGRSWCYDNNESNCNKYGRLYDWNTAMRICPSGWHLPTSADWNVLVNFVERNYSGGAGRHLKAKNGWYGDGNGTDTLGFSALPGGYRNSGGKFGNAGYDGGWWTATELGGNYAYNRDMGYGYDIVVEDYYRYDYENYGCSVRCVKD